MTDWWRLPGQWAHALDPSLPRMREIRHRLLMRNKWARTLSTPLMRMNFHGDAAAQVAFNRIEALEVIAGA
jgi:hypothetical protein